jgi:hypothetical protein
MSDSLKEAINKLRATKYAKANEKFDSSLADIDNYAANDEEKAFMLGKLFTDKNFSNHLPHEDKLQVMDAVTVKNLQAYFNGETEPGLDDVKFLGIVLLIVGVVAIVAGIIELIKGYFVVGISTRYLVPEVRSGGTWLIVGVGLFAGGFMRYRYENKKRNFIAHLLHRNK